MQTGHRKGIWPCELEVFVEDVCMYGCWKEVDSVDQ